MTRGLLSAASGSSPGQEALRAGSTGRGVFVTRFRRGERIAPRSPASLSGNAEHNLNDKFPFQLARQIRASRAFGSIRNIAAFGVWNLRIGSSRRCANMTQEGLDMYATRA